MRISRPFTLSCRSATISFVLGLLGLFVFGNGLVQAARPRAIIQGGNLVASDGTRLRAAPFFMSIYNTDHMRRNETLYREYFRSVSRDFGMNCVRVCPWIGNWEYDIKNNTAHSLEYKYMIEKCVQWADEDNIYVIIDLHIQFNTVLTRSKVDDFWSVIAPLYKDRTHVIFEAVNEPNLASAKSLMGDIYLDLRARAPNTHLILWSLNDPGGTNNDFQLQDLRNATKIRYDNASFAFHVYDYNLNERRRWDRAKSYRDAGYPVICTEMQSLLDGNNLPIYYPYLVDNIKHAREPNYNMSWAQWAPVFNFAAIDQYDGVSEQNCQIGFLQRYKDELNSAGINFWPANIPALPITGNSRILDIANTLTCMRPMMPTAPLFSLIR
jgi:hypothetical protein